MASYRPQVIVNATDFTMTRVHWPGSPMLYYDEECRVQVMQVHFWNVVLNSWVKLVPEKFEEPGVAILVLKDFQYTDVPL